MIIVGDIGNTEVKICFFYDGLKKNKTFGKLTFCIGIEEISF